MAEITEVAATVVAVSPTDGVTLQRSDKPNKRPKYLESNRPNDLQAGETVVIVYSDTQIIRIKRPTSSAFLNPYVMLASPKRVADAAWADAEPPGHSALPHGHYRGTVDVTITSESPLLLLDQGEAEPGGPALWVRRLDPDDDKPLLDPTSVKGMLRSAFEAVTVSRYGVFAGHNDPLTIRVGRTKEDFKKSPAEVLDLEDLRPSVSVEKLSPAERVFGWVGDERAETPVAAYRGHAWVEDVHVDRAEIVPLTETDPEGLQLTTLNSPKPEQYRFYLKDVDGKPLPSGRQKSINEGYTDASRLARKFYWPHPSRAKPDYWKPSPMTPHMVEEKDDDSNSLGLRRHGYAEPSWDAEARTYREYIAPVGTKPKVSRVINEWVAPGATFRFTLRFDGVTAKHLGVLLWLLDDQRLRFGLGGGKPLGFGTVRLSVEGSEIQSADMVRKSLSRWQSPVDGVDHSELLDVGVTSLDQAYPKRRETFAKISDPPEIPVHYPRTSDEPIAESYEWFMANEHPDGGKHSLPDIDDPALPYNPQA
ncbi:MAG: RAMP superfamily CRISPR-associated protein [Aeromicrobium sp.]|uniref:RAMP superfamily CRISPR-associated protein n=1 Tax=Aeromicrobium sp. TaxID=1871063 RepID=UPI0039E39EBD